MRLYDIYLTVDFNIPSVNISNHTMRDICTSFLGADIDGGVIVYSRYYRYKGRLKIVLRVYVNNISPVSIIRVNARLHRHSLVITGVDITKIDIIKLSPSVSIGVEKIC